MQLTSLLASCFLLPVRFRFNVDRECDGSDGANRSGSDRSGVQLDPPPQSRSHAGVCGTARAGQMDDHSKKLKRDTLLPTSMVHGRIRIIVHTLGNSILDCAHHRKRQPKVQAFSIDIGLAACTSRVILVYQHIEVGLVRSGAHQGLCGGELEGFFVVVLSHRRTCLVRPPLL